MQWRGKTQSAIKKGGDSRGEDEFALLSRDCKDCCCIMQRIQKDPFAQ